MDLMTLAAKIELNDDSYTKGIKNAESMGQQLAGKMSSMTVAVGNLAADMIRKGINGVQQIVGGAINGFADYQQLIGGVETLFKGSANKVAGYAKQAFKTTGLSANEYMETVTSFSASLLQGLGGDTEAAAELANTAIVDMADNANKMGTDISSIQAAYQGFAKQNYTMLDNLKLGYGGTASEMIRLINDSKVLDHQIDSLDEVSFAQIIEAIHRVQTEMGVTGTTAKEAADTISGSKASLKAAWEDLLTAVGGEGGQERLDETLANFKESFSTYITQFIPTLVETIGNSGTLVQGIADAIGDLPADLLTQVANAGLDAGAGMVGGASKILNWLIDSVINMFDSAKKDNSGVEKIASAIGELLGTAISKIATNAGTILDGILSVGEGLAKGLVDGLYKGLFGSDGAAGEMKRIKDQLAEDVVNVNLDDAKASSLLEYMQSLIDKYGNAATSMDEFVRAKADLEKVMPDAGKVFERYGSDVQGAVKELQALQREMKATAIKAGMTKALNAEYELLGELQTKKAGAEYSAETKQNEIDTIRTAMAQSLQAYVNEWVDTYGLESANSHLRQEIENLQNGLVYDSGKGELVDLMSADPKLLLNLLESYGAAINKDEESVWNKEYTDNIFDPETLKAFAEQSEILAAEIKDSLQEANDTQKEIEKVNQEIVITEGAVNKLSAEQNEGIREVVTALQQGGKDISAAMSFVSQSILNNRWGGEDSEDGSNAKGLRTVPFNGYRAILHRGERVLTASQARQRESKSDVSLTQVYETVFSAMRDGMRGVSVNSYLNGRRVSDDVSQNTTREVKARRFMV